MFAKAAYDRPMPVCRLALLALLCAAPAAAQPLSAGAGCGGDAFSSAQVIEHRAARRGPLTSVPDTLCADLAPQHPQADVRIEVYPALSPQVGSGGGGVPYGFGPPRPFRP